MESFCLSPPCLLLQSNFSQSRVSPDQAFPWIPGLAPQCPHREVHDGISEQEHLMEFNWSFVSSGTRTPFLPPSGCWFLRESAFSFLLCCFFFFLSESNGFLRYTVVGVSGDSLLETCPTQMESACCPWNCECQEPQCPGGKSRSVQTPQPEGQTRGGFLCSHWNSSAVIFQCGIIRTLARNLRCFVTLFFTLQKVYNPWSLSTKCR